MDGRGFFFLVGRLNILFKVSNLFSGASEQSLISKHPPLMGNSQIAWWNGGGGCRDVLVFKISRWYFTAAWKRDFKSKIRLCSYQAHGIFSLLPRAEKENRKERFVGIISHQFIWFHSSAASDGGRLSQPSATVKHTDVSEESSWNEIPSWLLPTVTSPRCQNVVRSESHSQGKPDVPDRRNLQVEVLKGCSIDALQRCWRHRRLSDLQCGTMSNWNRVQHNGYMGDIFKWKRKPCFYGLSGLMPTC